VRSLHVSVAIESRFSEYVDSVTVEKCSLLSIVDKKAFGVLINGCFYWGEIFERAKERLEFRDLS
jgi:hypothetical protein